MKKVEFKKITIKNFMSVGSQEIEVPFETGLNFITGYNEDTGSYNGVGKTTIINAFFFCLFGTLYGDNSGKLKLGAVVNNITRETPSCVKISLNSDGVDYEIIRQAHPSKCVILRDGNPENQNFSIAETNEEISRIVYGDADVYSNVIIMDSDSKPFILKEPSKRAKFIENVFSLEVFSKLHKDAVKEYGDKTKALSVATAEKNQVESFLDKLKYNRDNFEIDKTKRISEEERKIETYKKQFDELSSKFPQSQEEKIRELKDAHVEMSGKLNQVKEAKIKVDSKIESIKNDIKHLKSGLVNPDDLVCRLCKRPLDDHNRDEIEKENAKVQESIDSKMDELMKYEAEQGAKVKKAISAITAKLNDINSEISKAQTAHNLFLTQESTFKSLEDKIRSSESAIESIKKESNPYVGDIDGYEKDLKEKTEICSHISQEIEVLNYVKYICSPEGIKAFILSKIVKLFNESLEKYLIELNSEFKVTFDEFFEEHIVNANGAEVSYHSLSGGERKRVVLACIFAFRDIRRIQSNISINVSFMDELIDSALCSSGINKTMEILERSAIDNDEAIFIITHKMDQIDAVDKKIFNLVKRGGITTLENS